MPNVTAARIEYEFKHVSCPHKFSICDANEGIEQIFLQYI